MNNKQWIRDELQTVDLLDERLEKRFCKLLESLSQSSTASIPAACNDRAEMVAAYRFFDNDKVTFERVIVPHIESTYTRMKRQRVVLLTQDTTEVKSHLPKTQLVMLADRESDITQVIDLCSQQTGFDRIIRNDGDRVLNRENKAESSISLHESLRQTKPLFSRKLTIRERHSWGSATIKHRPGKADREARTVSVSVHSGVVTLNDPRVGKRDGVTVNAVLVRETKPTGSAEPVEWLLLTSLPVSSRAEVELVIEYYLQRWQIELFFKVLKSGCQIESRRFEHLDRFLPALALYLIVA